MPRGTGRFLRVSRRVSSRTSASAPVRQTAHRQPRVRARTAGVAALRTGAVRNRCSDRASQPPSAAAHPARRLRAIAARASPPSRSASDLDDGSPLRADRQAPALRGDDASRHRKPLALRVDELRLLIAAGDAAPAPNPSANGTPPLHRRAGRARMLAAPSMIMARSRRSTLLAVCQSPRLDNVLGPCPVASPSSKVSPTACPHVVLPCRSRCVPARLTASPSMTIGQPC